MNDNQIKILRDSYNVEAERPDGRKSTLGEYMRFITDCNLEFVSSKDMVLCDDTNSMVHCVCVNEDPHTQASFPAKIISAAYEDVHAVESIMSRENFEKFLNDGYFKDIEGWSDAKKEFMLKWINGIKIQAQQLPFATPYYTSQAGVVSMPNLPHNRDDGITSIKPSTSSKTFSVANNADDITKALKAGNGVILTNDVIIESDPLTIEGDAEINLNGHSLTSASGNRAIVINGGDVHIANGTIIGDGNDAILMNGIIENNGGPCTLTLGKDVNVVATDCCVLVKGPDAVLNTEAKMESTGGNYAAIQGNGSAGDIIVNIKGGEIISNDIGVYFPCKTTLNISGNAKISGTSGVYQKSGRLIITGGEIIGTGDKVEYVHNNNGANSTGDALIIEACDYPDGVPTVTIIGGTFTSNNANAVAYYKQSDEYAMSNEKFIRGGTFNTNVSKYVADNFEQNADGKVVKNYN